MLQVRESDAISHGSSSGSLWEAKLLTLHVASVDIHTESTALQCDLKIGLPMARSVPMLLCGVC